MSEPRQASKQAEPDSTGAKATIILTDIWFVAAYLAD